MDLEEFYNQVAHVESMNDDVESAGQAAIVSALVLIAGQLREIVEELRYIEEVQRASMN